MHVCYTFKRLFVDIEAVGVFLLCEDESLVHEEDVAVGPSPPRPLVHCELILIYKQRCNRHDK